MALQFMQGMDQKISANFKQHRSNIKREKPKNSELVLICWFKKQRTNTPVYWAFKNTHLITLC